MKSEGGDGKGVRERQIKRGRDIEMLLIFWFTHIMAAVASPRKPVARNFIWVFQGNAGTQTFAAFPDMLSGS